MPISRSRKIARNIGRSVRDGTITSTGSVSSGGGVTSYTTINNLPASHSAGDLAFVDSADRLYVSNGEGWYSVSIINSTPYWVSTPADAYSVDDSATPLVVTAKALDSDGVSVSYTGFASDSAQYLVNITTDSSVVTFTPLSADSVSNNATLGYLSESTGGNFTYTFRATDGIGVVLKASTITYLTDLSVIVDQTSTYTTPLQNADTYSYGNGLSGNSYSSSNYSWTIPGNSPIDSINSFRGFRKRIDWNVDEVVTAGNEILFAFACSGFGADFTYRGTGFIGFQNADYSKHIAIGRYDYNPSDSNYFYATADGTSNNGASTGVYRSAETSSAKTNWYMAIRLNTATGAVKGWVSYDNGSNWSERMYGTYANPSDLTHAFIATVRREGAGNKLALLDANNYKNTLTL